MNIMICIVVDVVVLQLVSCCPQISRGSRGNWDIWDAGHGVTALGVHGNSGDDLRNLLRGGIVAGVFHRRGASRQGDVRRKSRWNKSLSVVFSWGGC